MPDLIQFDCPSCAATLRVPIEYSGRPGPCPVCQTKIVAPDVHTGTGAYLAAASPTTPQPAAVTSPAPPPAPPAPEREPVQSAVAAPTAAELFPRVTALPTPAPASEVRMEPRSQPAARSPLGEGTTPPVRLIDPKTAPSPRAGQPQFRKMETLPPAPDYLSELAEEPRAPRRSLVPFVLIGCLLTAVAALALGFFFGNRFKTETPEPFKFPPQAPPVTRPVAPQSPRATPPSPKVNPVPAPPVGTSQSEPPKPVEPKPAAEPPKAIAAAEATLRAFLQAPDWAARSTYVLSPEIVGPKMEAYAKNNSDAATPFRSFTVQFSEIDDTTKSTLLIFEVDSPTAQASLPVAVLETDKGWLVDWESFVEFRDDHFKHFTEGPADLVGEFHVRVTTPPENSEIPSENDNFAGFVLAPPLPNRQKVAFIKKSNSDFARLRAATSGREAFVVLELTKRSLPDGRSYLEILSIKATNWWPRGT